MAGRRGRTARGRGRRRLRAAAAAPPPAAAGASWPRRWPEGTAGKAARARAGAEADGPAATRRGHPAGATPADRARAGPGGGRPTTVFVPGPDGQPKAQPIRTGITDGQYVEVVSGLEDGAAIITGIAGESGARTTAARPGASPATNPFAPQQPQRRTR